MRGASFTDCRPAEKYWRLNVRVSTHCGHKPGVEILHQRRRARTHSDPRPSEYDQLILRSRSSHIGQAARTHASLISSEDRSMKKGHVCKALLAGSCILTLAACGGAG